MKQKIQQRIKEAYFMASKYQKIADEFGVTIEEVRKIATDLRNWRKNLRDRRVKDLATKQINAIIK